MPKVALRVAGFLFLLVALLHLIRAIRCVAVLVGQISAPVSLSWIGVVVSFALGLWMLIAAKK